MFNWFIWSNWCPKWLSNWFVDRRRKTNLSVYTGDPIPRTLNEAVEQFIAGLTPGDLEFVKGKTPGSFHFSSGMGLRNNWGLWTNSVLAQWFNRELGIGHPDDMSGIILEAVWAKVRGELYDPKPTVERYRKHWQIEGIDMLTQERIGLSPKSYKFDAKTGERYDVKY